MLKQTILVVVMFTFSIASAEARQHHVAQQAICDNKDVMRPCAYNPNLISGIKEIKIKMYRERVVKREHAVKQTEARTSSIGNGIVRSISGATAHVAGSATQAFQCLVTALDNAGYPIKFMGGWRRYGSVHGSLHPLGLALDVNQYSRGNTRPRMPSNEIALASGCNLISGAQWAHNDSGHFQLGGYVGNGRRYRRYAQR